MTHDQSKYEQMLALVERGNSLSWHLDHSYQVDHLDKETVKGLTEALTALLEENATLRTEKHADAEAIGVLREALSFYADENRHGLPSDGPWGMGSTDFGRKASIALTALKGGNQ